jgi:hypothetical protein
MGVKLVQLRYFTISASALIAIFSLRASMRPRTFGNHVRRKIARQPHRRDPHSERSRVRAPTGWPARNGAWLRGPGCQREAVAEAQRGVEIFTNRYQLGADPYLQVVSAETIELLNERDEVDILRRRMDASVLLIKALGGSWDVSKLPQVSSMR